MAENGKLYDGMYPGVIDCNKKMAGVASVFVPNVTEACMVSDMYLDKPSLTTAELHEMAQKLLSMGPRDLVITGCEPSDRDVAFNYVYDHETDAFHEVVYERIPTQFIGTGDLFSGILTAECLSGSSILHAVKVASSFISIVLQDNLDTEDHYDLHFERYMKLLNI